MLGTGLATALSTVLATALTTAGSDGQHVPKGSFISCTSLTFLSVIVQLLFLLSLRSSFERKDLDSRNHLLLVQWNVQWNP